jgi:hypothetical protein
MGFFDDMEKKGTQARPSEITGKQHGFHSYPKEFQAWHNTQYVLEKKVTMDRSTIPTGLLNSYMWKVVGDGSGFGFLTALNIVVAVIILKYNPTIIGFLLASLVFMPWLLYTAYHFVFYAKIRAQIVGPVTEECARYIVNMFYESFGAVTVALIIAFVFMFSFLESIGELTSTIYHVSEGHVLIAKAVTEPIRHSLALITNFIADMTEGPDYLLGQILFNTYFSTALFTGITAYTVVMFEKREYAKRRAEVDAEIMHETFNSGYPIEKALFVLHKWRKENE